MELSIFIGGVVAYICIGNFIANHYFARRHGVRGRLGWYRSVFDFDAGTMGAVAVSATWPISMFLSWVRDPDLCTHQHHVLARQEAQHRWERTEEALRRERGGR